MAVTLNASASAGLITTADTSTILQLQTGGTTALAVSAAQVVTLTNPLPVASGGSGGTTSTGSGANVLGTTPSFTSTIGVGGATASASGAGITFPAAISASSDANTLDDYEEGTWTPTLSSTETAPTVSAYDTQQGIYTRVGNLVTVTASVRATISSVGTGVPLITGFPFSSAGFLEGVSVGLCTILTGVSSSLGWWYVSGATVQVASAATYNTNAQAYLTFTASYRVA